MTNLSTQSGVDLDAGNAISKHGARVSRETMAGAALQIHDYSGGHFRGPIGFDPMIPAGTHLIGAADGVGTKVVFRPRTAGYDLVAMTSGDITRRGGKTLALWNVLDTSTLGTPGSDAFQFFTQLIDGLGAAAKKEGIALMGGETAELGSCVGSENPQAPVKFNWAGFALGAIHPDYRITGEHIAPRQKVVALRESGPRSNGISSIRKALRYRFGVYWWEDPEAEAWIAKAAEPSTLYDRFLTEANGWGSDFKERIPVTGIAHITGGGIPEKFGDILFPTGHSAELYDLWSPLPIMSQCAEWLREERKKRGEPPITDLELYQTWNGGQGVLAVLEPRYVNRFVSLAKHFGIDAKECGVIVSTQDVRCIRISSKYGSGETLEILAPAE